MPSNILVLGLGNTLLRDEGLGIHALQRLQEVCRLPEDIALVDGGVMGLELLSYLEDATEVLVLDAVQTGQPPGTLVRLEGEEIPTLIARKLSMHQIGFQETLALSRFRGSLPGSMVLLGIEPATVELGLALSEPVALQIEPLVQAAVQELRAWGAAVELRP